MTDETCVAFLQWALPRLRMSWAGFRRVRGQVCKRLRKRCQELALDVPDGYRAYLADHPEEWARLDRICRITISRFYRDRRIFDYITSDALPRIAKRRPAGVRCWSAGCCSGEEAYTLQILWRLRLGSPAGLVVGGTDTDAVLLERARRGVYPKSSVRDLPGDLAEEAFDFHGEEVRLRGPFRAGVEFRQQDLRQEMPAGPFDLILCRNLVFTYYDRGLQRQLLPRLVERLADGGVLVTGRRETLPETGVPLVREAEAVYRLGS